jgi:hypothetical protein
MKLFKLYCVDNPGWDCNHGFVIRAKDEISARNLAQTHIADERSESKDFWLGAKFSTCEEITVKGESEIILNDFNAG